MGRTAADFTVLFKRTDRNGGVLTQAQWAAAGSLGTYGNAQRHRTAASWAGLLL